MNWEQVEGKWKETKGKVREQWGKLTDQDLEVIGGKKDKLLGKLQQSYGIGKERASEDVDQWLSKLDEPTEGELTQGALKNKDTRSHDKRNEEMHAPKQESKRVVNS